MLKKVLTGMLAAASLTSGASAGGVLLLMPPMLRVNERTDVPLVVFDDDDNLVENARCDWRVSAPDKIKVTNTGRVDVLAGASGFEQAWLTVRCGTATFTVTLRFDADARAWTPDVLLARSSFQP